MIRKSSKLFTVTNMFLLILFTMLSYCVSVEDYSTDSSKHVIGINKGKQLDSTSNVLYNSQGYHNEVMLAFESYFSLAVANYITIDRRDSTRAQHYHSLFHENYRNNRVFRSYNINCESTNDVQVLIDMSPKIKNGKIVHKSCFSAKLTIYVIHTPKDWIQEEIRLIAETATVIIFPNQPMEKKWSIVFKAINPSVVSMYLVLVADVSNKYTTSLLTEDVTESDHYKSKIVANRYVIIPGKQSDRRRNYREVGHALREGIFDKIDCYVAGIEAEWENINRKARLPAQVVKPTDESQLYFIPFFASIQASIGVFPAHHVNYWTVYEDQSTGSIATAISNGVPIIADMKILAAYPSLRKCMLVYKIRDITSQAGLKMLTEPYHSSKIDPVAVLQTVYFETFGEVLRWLRNRSEQQLDLIKKSIIDSRNEILSANVRYLHTVIMS